MIVEGLDAGRGDTLDAALQRLERAGGGEVALAERPALRGEASRIGLALAELFGGADWRDVAALLGPGGEGDGRASGEPGAMPDCGCGGSRGGAGGTELMLMSTSTTTSTSGGNYEDLNGNGQWDEGEPLVVTGTGPSPNPGFSTGPGDTGGVGGTPVGEGPGSPGGSGGGTVTTVPNPTPCVSEDATPSGAPLHQINTAALAAANAIEAKTGLFDEEHVEWGSLVYVLNGVAGFTQPFTQHSQDSISITVGALSAVPDGAVIVGFVHNHTALGVNSGMNQRAPSSADWQIRDGLTNFDIGRGVTVDPNMLLYIHAPSAAGIHDGNKTRVYDRTDRNEASECSLQ